MDVNSIKVKDTDGALANESFKNQPDIPAASVWFAPSGNNVRSLMVSPNNIKYTAVPNIQGATYISFLAYNGTLGYSDKLFSTVVVQDQGIFNVADVPALTYNPNTTIIPPDQESLDDRVLDIKMYNGVVDIITYTDGILKDGEKYYQAKAIQSYPTVVTELPQVAGKRVFMDGWYTYTNILFRNIAITDMLVEGQFYGYEGFIFKASISGEMDVNAEGQVVIVVNGIDHVQESNTDYKELLFSLDSTDGGPNAQSGNEFLNSQILVTDEIRDAIILETVDASLERCCGPMQYRDWMKLTMKQTAAAVMFDNGLFENAQIILESARPACSITNYNTSC